MASANSIADASADAWDWLEFVHDIRQLCAWSERLGDTWQLIETNNKEEEGNIYMRKQVKLLQSLPADSSKSPKTSQSSQTAALPDLEDPCEVVAPTRSDDHLTLLSYDFHVLFHRSYRVPTLCFQASRPDGRHLTLDEAWQLFGDPAAQMTVALTQMDHPVLYRPFHTVHPCRTAELLQHCHAVGSANRVLSFVSAMGPYVGLHMDVRYGKMLEVKDEVDIEE